MNSGGQNTTVVVLSPKSPSKQSLKRSTWQGCGEYRYSVGCCRERLQGGLHTASSGCPLHAEKSLCCTRNNKRAQSSNLNIHSLAGPPLTQHKNYLAWRDLSQRKLDKRGHLQIIPLKLSYFTSSLILTPIRTKKIYIHPKTSRRAMFKQRKYAPPRSLF